MYEEGKQEGLKEGKQEGLKEKLGIARSLLARDMAIPDIAEITGLSEEAYPGDHSDAIDGLYAFPDPWTEPVKSVNSPTHELQYRSDMRINNILDSWHHILIEYKIGYISGHTPDAERTDNIPDTHHDKQL